MAYVVKKQERSLFEFEYNGEYYSIPKVSSLTPREASSLMKYSTGSDKDTKTQAALLDFLLQMLDKYAPHAVDEMTTDELGDLLQAWQKESESNDKITVGE
jgi:hypothetical protein